MSRIELLTEDRLGYWRLTRGITTEPTPWKEERFLAADLDLQTVRQLVTSRNFEGRDLRGIAAAGLDLQGLQAAGTKLRDAHFEGADLRQPISTERISRGHTCSSPICGAPASAPIRAAFRPIWKGRTSRGADLRGASFRGASLFGVTLGPAENGS